MDHKITIRVANPVIDAEACRDIYAHSVRNAIATFEEIVPSTEEVQQRIDKLMVTHPWLVAELDNAVVGYAYASQHQPRAGYRWTAETSVYVSTAAAGKGVGTALYSKLIEVLKHQGFKNLLAIISTPNPASEALHTNMGFAMIGRFDSIGFKLGKWQQTCWWQARIGVLDESPTPPSRFSDVLKSESFQF